MKIACFSKKVGLTDRLRNELKVINTNFVVKKKFKKHVALWVKLFQLLVSLTHPKKFSKVYQKQILFKKMNFMLNSIKN